MDADGAVRAILAAETGKAATMAMVRDAHAATSSLMATSAKPHPTPPGRAFLASTRISQHLQVGNMRLYDLIMAYKRRMVMENRIKRVRREANITLIDLTSLASLQMTQESQIRIADEMNNPLDDVDPSSPPPATAAVAKVESEGGIISSISNTFKRFFGGGGGDSKTKVAPSTSTDRPRRGSKVGGVGWSASSGHRSSSLSFPPPPCMLHSPRSSSLTFTQGRHKEEASSIHGLQA